MTTHRRTFLLLLPGAALSSVMAQEATKPSSTTPQVVFVCEHGAAKSIIAASHFNKLAAERGLPHRAISRATNPDPAIASKVIEGLQGEGVPIVQSKPQLVSEQDTAKAAKVVTFGCKLPKPNTPILDWADAPSPSANYSVASKDIQKRVEALVDQLAAEAKGTKK
jgi:arsenate reductase (thioredoxin)